MSKADTNAAARRGASGAVEAPSSQDSLSGRNRGTDLPEDWQLNGNVAHYFSRIINRLNLDLADRVRALDITAQHYRVLQILYFGDGITIGALRKRIVITLPVLSRVLDQMQQRGLLVRQSKPEDARYTYIFLTQKGVDAYEKAWPEARPIIDDALEGLTRSELRTLLSLIQKIDGRINE
ncbi:MarR family winged helix-turn-helix transcriptional regulator [Pusillimonas noertemannii]|uniref:MarR family winged helix-turn-helix transcriptional regulator n=1 Tax=Pusillimonas noertemannii TaxID=305977 RepID=UPI00036AAD11|nr:MarR family transcriptional regulator [Pusillimonas noertemannii]